MRLRFTTTGTLPAPLQANTDYWAIAADLNNFKVALSLNDATFGNAVDLTTGGSGNHTASYKATQAAVRVLCLEHWPAYGCIWSWKDCRRKAGS